jgi:Fe-S cluster biosynthesis and repair protein YggX
MARKVFCQVLKEEAEGLERVPHPGELGKRIYESVSREGWQRWLDRLQMIMNENRLSSADPLSIELIERHMAGFFFEEGDFGGLPTGFRAPGAKK